MNFSDKVAVITGGSKGFGKALAEAFVREGATVIITSTNKDELETTANEIGAHAYAADASSRESTSLLRDFVIEKCGKIDIWVNNAGIQIAPSKTEEVDVNRLKELFGINFFGYFYGCQAALQIMKQQNQGTIINVNSTAGLGGKSGLSAYVSSKFAIRGLTETIREEIKDSPIEIYQIFPGGMKTDIYHERVPDDIDQYMDVSYAIDKVMANLKLDQPELDQIIKRPNA